MFPVLHLPSRCQYLKYTVKLQAVVGTSTPSARHTRGSNRHRTFEVRWSQLPWLPEVGKQNKNTAHGSFLPAGGSVNVLRLVDEPGLGMALGVVEVIESLDCAPLDTPELADGPL